ncbi:unnamed protein product, partial [Adineta ricciae]
LRRYTKRLISSLDEFSSQSNPTSMWLVHFYNYFNGHFTRFDLSSLTKLISKSITPKSIPFFHQIHLLVEQLLYRFIYYHHYTSQIYLALSNTFSALLRDGFQMPPEESEENEEQKTEGGMSGMGEGQVGKDAKDVSDQIETEDQLDEAKAPGQEQEETKEQESVTEEKNGMEVSFDFEGDLEDPSKGEDENEDENEKESDADDDNMEDQMGDVDEDDQGEVFDEKKWGDEDKEE